MSKLENGSGTHFGASQCISIDLDADAAAAARCVHTLINKSGSTITDMGQAHLVN